MALTDLKVKNLKPRSQRYEVADTKGLYIRIAPSGEKTWIFRYVFDGIRNRLTLGSYPGVTIEQAHQKRGEAKAKIQNGINPGVLAKEQKARRKADPTFSDMLAEIWERELQHKKSGLATRKLLEKDAVPAWGKRKITDLKRRDIVLLLDKIRDRAPIVANRVHGALSRLFNFAAERGVIEDSPCTRIRKTTEKGRSRVLTDDEIRMLWKALDLENAGIAIYRVSRLALKMILLTGQRPGEVVGMRWDEIDGDFWNIPAERMKGGEPQRVPLCPMAANVIEQAEPYSAECEYVFQSSYKPGEPITRQCLTRAVARHWSEIGFSERFSPHDLRRTLRTRLAEIGVPDIVAERVLGHKLQGMMAIYNQHSYDVEKRQSLMRWEGRLKEVVGLVEPRADNVIQFGGRR